MPEQASPPGGTAERRPSKPLHLMNDEERLQALKEWAEEKKYIHPGEGGTFASGDLGSLVRGGPLRTVVSGNRNTDRWAGQYEAPVGPPSYERSTEESSNVEKTGNALTRWMQKLRTQKEARRDRGLPAYAP